jgi:Divergent InlB B-repeat domain
VSRGLAAVSLAALLVVTAAGAAPGADSPAAARVARSSLTAEIDTRSASARLAATTAWCGAAAQADRVPNAIAGNPVHWVYLIPSDGTDGLSTVANAMQSDADQVDAWWRGQDASRVPRNDVTRVSCGTQLDITTVRSSLSGSQLTPISSRFSGIADTLERAGFSSPLTKYLVYYDGPIDDDNICGQGGSESNGLEVAVVYYRSCVGVSTAAVAAHEFLHTIGAVPTGAPNECTGDNAGHTCDNESDLMYPALGSGPLSLKVLDPGRNDYYGHAGTWLDTQDSAWLVRLDSQAQLAINLAGPGSVSADVPGLQCSSSCTTTWNSGQSLALTATPATGAKLVRWSGGCSGSAGCNLTVAPGTTLSALFAPATFRLTVVVTGRGAVRSTGAGIACRPRCSASFPSYSPLRLTASPAKGWKLRSWTGACRGSKKACTVPMSAATKARATFIRA